MYPSIRFRPRRDGKFKTPKLYCYINFNGLKAVPFSTSIECNYKYDLKAQSFKGAAMGVSVLNDAIEKIRTDIRDTFNRINRGGAVITAQMIRDTYTSDLERKYKPVPNLSECFNEWIESKRKSGKYEKITLNKFGHAKSCAMDYIKHKTNKSDIELSSISVSDATQFVNYLKSKTTKNGTPITHDYAYRAMKYLKDVLDFAVMNDYIQVNPFSSASIKNDTTNKPIKPLSEEQILKFRDYQTTHEIERAACDMFVSMFYCGLSYADYVRFANAPNDFIFCDSDGFQFIEIYRFKNRKHKNQTTAFIPLLPELKKMLDKYNYKLPVLIIGTFNRYIRTVSGLVGIEQHITSYDARKSFAIHFGNLDGVEVKTISKMMGHKKVSTTENYYFRVSNETVKRQMLKFTKQSIQ